MKKHLLPTLLVFSLFANIGGGIYYYEIQNKRHALEDEKLSNIEFFEEKTFASAFSIKDYSSVLFSLSEKGKDIIKNAREFHSVPALVKGEDYDSYLCAGFLFELSAIFWGDTAPYRIGMMEQNTKEPADAWQLPYSYEYVGGEILHDFTGDFSLEKKDYWESIDIKKLQDFFAGAFSEEALLGDIGFLYKDTGYLKDLKTYQNSNSHITKNLGVSEFSKTLSSEDIGINNSETFSKSFSCDGDVFSKIKNLLTHYELFLDEQKIVFYKDDFYLLNTDMTIGEQVSFDELSTLTIKDISLTHFFQGAHVQSLFEMTCSGDFFPINILSLNPRFVEKM